MKKTVSFILMAMLSLSLSAAKVVTSASLKLVADGKTLNTEAIQNAIDVCLRRVVASCQSARAFTSPGPSS